MFSTVPKVGCWCNKLLDLENSAASCLSAGLDVCVDLFVTVSSSNLPPKCPFKSIFSPSFTATIPSYLTVPFYSPAVVCHLCSALFYPVQDVSSSEVFCTSLSVLPLPSCMSTPYILCLLVLQPKVDPPHIYSVRGWCPSWFSVSSLLLQFLPYKAHERYQKA